MTTRFLGQPKGGRLLELIGIGLTVAACAGAPTPTGSPTTVTTSASASVSAITPSSRPATSPAGTTSASAQAGPRTTLGLGVVGRGDQLAYTVALPDTWHDVGGSFAVKYDIGEEPAPILGVSVWDVGQFFRDPCHWDGSGYDPGPTVDDLVDAIVAQPTRSPTTPKDVTLAGYAGQYVEWSVPPDLKSSTWTDFDDCDIVEGQGHRNFQSWLGRSAGTRWSQVPGQVDRLWILDVDGKRLVVDATYSPDTSEAERAEQAAVVDSLAFIAP